MSDSLQIHLCGIIDSHLLKAPLVNQELVSSLGYKGRRWSVQQPMTRHSPLIQIENKGLGAQVYKEDKD